MNVLLATDLSEAGLRSVEGLCACDTGSFERVTLLHVVDLDLYTAGGSIPGITDWAHEELGKAAGELRERGFAVDTRVETGPAVETIHAVADEIGADLIVTTNLGKGAIVGRFLGSTAERLAGAADRPVLIERVEHDGGRWCRLGAASPFQRVLLGVDLEEGTRPVIERAKGLPGLESLRIVHVVPEESARESALERLEDIVRGVEVGVTAQAAVVVGDAADRLLAEARATDASVIALAPCRHGMLHRGILGSVARSVALNADRGVLLLPSGERA